MFENLKIWLILCTTTLSVLPFNKVMRNKTKSTLYSLILKSKMRKEKDANSIGNTLYFESKVDLPAAIMFNYMISMTSLSTFVNAASPGAL